MKDSTKNNFILPVIVLIIGSFIISPIANAWYDPTQKTIPLVTPALRFFSFVWNDLLNFKIPVWILILTFLIIIYIAYRIIKNTEVSKFSATQLSLENDIPYEDDVSYEDMKEILGPDYLSYKQDTLKGWKWGWEYKCDKSRGRYTIEELRPICSKCEMKSIDNISNVDTICPNCDNIFNIHSTAITARNKIKALIQNKIDNSSF
jgi:hypothetical protein